MLLLSGSFTVAATAWPGAGDADSDRSRRREPQGTEPHSPNITVASGPSERPAAVERGALTAFGRHLRIQRPRRAPESL
jgi:hypothetical protein